MTTDHLTKLWRCAATLAACVAIFSFSLTRASASTTYTDGFEGSTFNPFWNLVQTLGSVTPSTTQAHSGSQSAQFTSTGGGQRNLDLIHSFGQGVQGDFTVYFYDAAPGQQTLYENLNLFNTVTNIGAGVGTQDFDAFCYTAAAIGNGPNANCGVFPLNTTTNVARTLGWHRFDINVDPGILTILIDGTQVYQVPGNYVFDTVTLNVSGPGFRPNTTAFFDDFRATYTAATTPTPEPASGILIACALIGFWCAQWTKLKRRHVVNP